MQTNAILWLTENYFPRIGGMAQSCDRIVYHLRQAGLIIHLIHLTNQTSTKKESVYNGTNLHFPINQSQNTNIDESHVLNLLWNEICEEKNISHVVCFGGYLTMTAAPIFATWLAVPLVVLLRGNDFDASIFSPKKREVLDFALQRAKTVACVTQEKTEKIKKLYPKTQAIFTPNGIDATEWKPLSSDEQKAQEIKNSFLTPTTKRVIGMFGQLKAKKGVQFFMEALQQCDFANQIHLLIVGEMSIEVQQFLEIETVAFTYTHFPFMARFDLLPYYLACDTIAIPSFYDGMPNVLLEAGAVGIPFISSDTGGMIDVLQEDFAWFFKTGNTDSCVQALENFWHDSFEEIHTKGKLTQEHITQNFTFQQERDNYLGILR